MCGVSRDGIPGAVRLDEDGTARSETRGGERETTSAACKGPKASPEGVTYPASSRVRVRGGIRAFIVKR